jgi:hypothetical protein
MFRSFKKSWANASSLLQTDLRNLRFVVSKPFRSRTRRSRPTPSGRPWMALVTAGSVGHELAGAVRVFAAIFDQPVLILSEDLGLVKACNDFRQDNLIGFERQSEQDLADTLRRLTDHFLIQSVRLIVSDRSLLQIAEEMNLLHRIQEQ